MKETSPKPATAPAATTPLAKPREALAQARGILPKSGIKQVDRLLSNAGVVPWDLFAAWVRGKRHGDATC